MSTESRDPLRHWFIVKTRTRFRRFVYVALAALALWIASGIIAGFLLTRRIDTAWIETLPSSAPKSVHSVRIQTDDNIRLGAWFYPGSSSDCVLLFHGNRASRTAMYPLFSHLIQKENCVLAVSIRAHGDSEGTILDAGWSARHDVIGAVTWLEKHTSNQRFIVIGRSMGAAAALFAAKELEHRVAGYFLEAPYRDLETATRIRTKIYLPPILDKLAFYALKLWSSLLFEVPITSISPLRHASHIPEGTPVILLSGTDDQLAPIHDVHLIRNAIGINARMLVFENAKHESLFRGYPKRYMHALMNLRTQIK